LRRKKRFPSEGREVEKAFGKRRTSMRYMKQFAGFALVLGLALSSATVASAASADAWHDRDYRMEQRLRAERIREARLRAEIARERYRHIERRY
jgi:hypothetical protein